MPNKPYREKRNDTELEIIKKPKSVLTFQQGSSMKYTYIININAYL